MKKTFILLLTAMSCSLAFLSCGFNNLQVPKKVNVKTDATYEFSVMNFDSEKEGSKFKISNYFDLGKTLEEKTASTSESSGMKIYKYNDGSQFQQFLIHMPLKEIDFDFSESFKDMDISKEVKSFNIDKSFEVPNVDALDKPPQPLDLSSIMTVLNTAVRFTGKTESSATLSLTLPPFTSMSYTSGYLVVEATGDVSGTMALYHGTDFISQADFDSNNIARLSLENATLYSSSMTFKYTGSDTNVDFEATIDSSSIIHTATGVNVLGSAYTIPKTTVTFDVDLDDTLKQVIIEEGTIAITISNPEGWSDNVIADYEIDISDALTPTVHYVKPGPSAPSDNGKLDGCELHKAQMKAEADVSLDLTGGKTIVFANPPMVKVETHITKVTAEKEMGDELKTDITQPQAVGKDVTDYVNSITWKNQGAGFIVKASNNLPNNANNKMSLSLTSTELGVTDSNPKDILPGQENQELKYLCGENVTTTMTEGKEIDITGHLVLPEGPHSTTSNKTIIVSDVVPGKEYNISLVVEPVFEWAKANVKLPADKTQFKDAMDTSLNKNTLFSVLGENFGKNVNIKEMPLFVYANIPKTMRKGMDFKGTITAVYGTGKDSEGHIIELSPSVKTSILPANSTISTTNNIPAFEINEAGEVTNKFEGKTADFATAMNLVANEGTLWLDYDIKLEGANGTGIDVTREDMDGLKAQGKSNVKIDIVVLFSMDFEVTDTVDIDMLSIVNKKDGDLLGRSQATDTAAYQKYLDVIQSATISIEKFQIPMTGNISFKVDSKKDGNAVSRPVGNGETFSIEVNPKDVLDYPYSPDIRFVLEKGNFGILRTMPISGKIKLKIAAKGEIPVYPFSEQN